VHGKMRNYPKKLAPKPQYVSPKQLTIEGFETPFERKLNPENRWVKLGMLIPWDEICGEYLKHVGVSQTGRKPLNPRIVIGALIVKHMCNLDDRETVDQISENVYMQYFLGYSSFDTEPPFDASLFVEIRKRLGIEALNALNEKIITLKTRMGPIAEELVKSEDSHKDDNSGNGSVNENKGRVIFDATACPQDIAYPTDLTLLSDAREKSEEIIDKLYDALLHDTKPRTYRKVARKAYLQTAQKKVKTRKELRRAIRKQLAYLNRNIISIDKLLDAYPVIPLNSDDYKYMLVIRTLYDQQKYMYERGVHSIDDRIVSIHQPHVRPIVRGKSQSKVEFGPKIHISVIDGITFLDELSWDAYNEGSHMMDYIEQYFRRFGFYPREVLADKIYCTRENRRLLKEKDIKLIGKSLGRPSAVKEHVRPGERNPVEGKFGQAKTGYGLDRIRARLKDTSESWIASIILVLNLVKLAGSIPCAVFSRMEYTFSMLLNQIIGHEVVVIQNIKPGLRLTQIASVSG
jgi:transposase, IS5 family